MYVVDVNNMLYADKMKFISTYVHSTVFSRTAFTGWGRLNGFLLVFLLRLLPVVFLHVVDLTGYSC